MKNALAEGLNLIIISIFIGAGGQILLKLGANRLVISGASIWESLLQAGLYIVKNPLILGGLLLFGISSFLWIIAVSKVDLSMAYPMVSIGYGIVLFASWAFLGEAVSWLRVSGVLVICLGVLMVAQS